MIIMMKFVNRNWNLGHYDYDIHLIYINNFHVNNFWNPKVINTLYFQILNFKLIQFSLHTIHSLLFLTWSIIQIHSYKINIIGFTSILLSFQIS